MMHKNKFWLGFLALITLTMGWFTWQTLSKTKDYFALSDLTTPSSITWSAIKMGEDHYLLSANYSFLLAKKEITKTEILTTPIYPNPWAAELAASKQEGKKWHIWYAPNDPKHASLYKHFPTKELISTIILWGVWIYFLWLGFYVTKFSNN